MFEDELEPRATVPKSSGEGEATTPAATTWPLKLMNKLLLELPPLFVVIVMEADGNCELVSGGV